MEAFKTLVAQLGPKRLALMGGVAIALLAALAFVATRGSDPQMGFLYTDLDPASAQAMTEKLAAQNLPYQLSADGTSILAPQDKLAELRMAMAGDRLGGKIGYDVLDQEEPFGVSASRAKMNETRAIEGELARSIQSLQGVTGARVHIVMPERAMFATQARKATAAVTVRTKGRLPKEAVASIRYLVASSVPELAPEAVSVVDQSGALLARAGDPGEAGAADADERQASVEAKLRDEVEALLEPIVGQGKVRAEVSAEIDRDQTREEATVFDPDTQVIARQVTVETGNQNQETGAGQPAASVAAQLPENAAQPGLPGESRNSNSSQTSEDTSYQNSSKQTLTVRAPGKVTRLTVAVMVDGGPRGLPQPQIQRITRLVENAVGIDAERGDSVVVESMKFAEADAGAEEAGGLLAMLPTDRLFGLLQLAIIAAVGLVALRMIRPKQAPAPLTADGGKLAAEGPPQLALEERAAKGDLEAVKQLEVAEQHRAAEQLDQDIALAQVDGQLKLSAIKRVGDAISASPPEAASVIRQWMNA